MNLKHKNPLVVFDLEATGLDLIHDRIVEFCFLKINIDGSQTTWTERLNPMIPISKESSDIHGIYDDDVKDAKTFKQVAKNIDVFLKGCDIGGYNIIKFDIPLLLQEFSRAQVPFDITKKKLVDAQKIFHTMEKRNLAAAYKFYCGETLENAHSAEADTVATWQVIDAQAKQYDGQMATDMKGNQMGALSRDIDSFDQISKGNMVDFGNRLSSNESGDIVFNFGKYKGKRVSDVFLNNPAYYDWLMKSDFTDHFKSIVTNIKLGKKFQS